MNEREATSWHGFSLADETLVMVQDLEKGTTVVVVIRAVSHVLYLTILKRKGVSPSLPRVSV